MDRNMKRRLLEEIKEEDIRKVPGYCRDHGYRVFY